MHVTTAVFIVFLVWRYGDWKNWQKYHNTMLFIATGNLLYNFITANHFLWRLEADFLTNHTLSEFLYTFIVFPGTVLLFLSKFPRSRRNRIIHVLSWISYYSAWEYYLIQLNLIKYQYGWNLGYSILFDFIMFPTLLIHHKKPLIAYLISIIIVIIVVIYFNVPVHLPVEDR